MCSNFTLDEFDCGCCGNNEISLGVIIIMQEIRDIIEEPVIITSGYRCVKHNKNEGGADKSKHLLGVAVDFTVRNYPLKSLYDVLSIKYKGRYGLIYYRSKNIIHIDTRSEPYRDIK